MRLRSFSIIIFSMITLNYKKINANTIKNQYIVKIKENALNAFSNSKDFQRLSRRIPLFVFEGDNTKIKNQLYFFQNDIEYIEPVYEIRLVESFADSNKTTLNEEFPGQWALENNNDTDVDIIEAWQYTKGKSDIVVAVIDTGVDYNHSELKYNIWSNQNEIPDNNVDDDQNGYVDDTRGWNFSDNSNDPFDDNSHGTHCAGIIAAQGNKTYGVAPGVKVMPLKFLSGNGSGSTAGAILAIDYAIEMKADVLSNSWGGSQYSKALKEIIEKAHEEGIIFAAAAGNNGKNLDQNKMYPASYEVDNIISVANIQSNGKLHYSSNFSTQYTDLAAPGAQILSTIPGESYASYTGTSMSTPFVAGAVSLLLSVDGNLDNKKIKNILKKTVKKSKDLTDKTNSGGFLKIAAAIKELINPGEDEDPFDINLMELRTRSYKRWFQTHHRLIISTHGPKNYLEKIDKVVYEYKKDNSTQKHSSKSAKNKFQVKLKTMSPKQEVRATLYLKDGRKMPISKDLLNL